MIKMKPFSQNSRVGRRILSWVKGYNHDKYWKRREYVVCVNKSGGVLTFIRKMYYLYYIKKVDARHHCSFGTNVNDGAIFLTPPYLPHGPDGIIVGRDVKVGREVIIYHQVTIASGDVVIGDHTELGAGAKVLPNVKIGHHVHVGANCVVVEDIPDYATVVLQKPRVIIKQIKE